MGCSSVFIKIFACFPTQQNVVNPKHPTEVLSRNWCPCSGHSRRVRGVLVLERLTKRSSGEPGADAGADCLEPPEYGYGGQAIRVASSRAGGVASHQIDGAAMDVLMEYVGWRSSTVASRYVGNSGISRGVEGDQAFARPCTQRSSRLTTVGGVCGIVLIVRTGQTNGSRTLTYKGLG